MYFKDLKYKLVLWELKYFIYLFISIVEQITNVVQKISDVQPSESSTQEYFDKELDFADCKFVLTRFSISGKSEKRRGDADDRGAFCCLIFNWFIQHSVILIINTGCQ